jgi:hypothetical protein
MIISSFIISKSLSEPTSIYGNLNGSINGSITVSNTDSYYNNSDVLQAYDAGVMLGYEYNAFIQDINNGKLEGIPYLEIGDHYIFSKKALEEWVYKKSLD